MNQSYADYNTMNDSINPYSIVNMTNLNISGFEPDVDIQNFTSPSPLRMSSKEHYQVDKSPSFQHNQQYMESPSIINTEAQQIQLPIQINIIPTPIQNELFQKYQLTSPITSEEVKQQPQQVKQQSLINQQQLQNLSQQPIQKIVEQSIVQTTIQQNNIQDINELQPKVLQVQKIGHEGQNPPLVSIELFSLCPQTTPLYLDLQNLNSYHSSLQELKIDVNFYYDLTLFEQNCQNSNQINYNQEYLLTSKTNLNKIEISSLQIDDQQESVNQNNLEQQLQLSQISEQTQHQQSFENQQQVTYLKNSNIRQLSTSKKMNIHQNYIRQLNESDVENCSKQGKKIHANQLSKFDLTDFENVLGLQDEM
ncbi:Hypothetical_protein [Hexamita inflata]|uniref:Hypothetical_protein n=1 Tax=Hexamita inflata TaxID=28002 RepID=A0AA86PZX5_9EUKA|nr:Hypothetical protein HINF_LOCUS30609 [Hexamita inflata]